MRVGDWAWLVLVALVVGYEVFAPPGQLLSQMMDTYRHSFPVTINLLVLYFAGHLTRVWPPHLDPLSVLGTWLGR